MSGGLRRTLSVLIVCFSALGIILSVFLLVQVWRYRQPLSENLQQSLDQFSTVLHTTDDALVVLDQVTKNVYSSTLYLDGTINTLSQSMGSTNSFIESVSSFIGDDLISTITNTQVALNSAQASAKVIDDILTTMSRIPLVGITYDPNLPLNIALGDVSASLDPLPITLKNFQTSLETTHTNLELFTLQISDVDQNITAINQNIKQAQLTIDNYRDQLSSLISWVDQASDRFPAWINSLAWATTIVIVWFLFLQITILLQGFTNLSSNHSNQSPPDDVDKSPA